MSAAFTPSLRVQQVAAWMRQSKLSFAELSWTIGDRFNLSVEEKLAAQRLYEDTTRQHSLLRAIDIAEEEIGLAAIETALAANRQTATWHLWQIASYPVWFADARKAMDGLRSLAETATTGKRRGLTIQGGAA